MKKVSKNSLRKHLDIIAETLDKHGFEDLGARIDYYNSRLMKASIDEAILIKRALARVSEEIRRRLVVGEKNKPPIEKNKEYNEGEASAEKFEQKTVDMGSAEDPKELLRKRLSALATSRRKIAEKLATIKKNMNKGSSVQDLRVDRKARLEK